MPAPVTAPGLPARRFWEFEDGRLNLAALRPAETDLGQLLLIETLSGFGNDWFVIGVELPVGQPGAATSLVVTDTFGARTLLRPHGDHRLGATGRWGLFQHAMPFDSDEPEGVADHQPALPRPRLAQPVVGPVVEQVVLARDEQANLGWAVEQLLRVAAAGGRRAGRRPTARSRPATRDVAPDYHLAQGRRRTGSRCSRSGSTAPSRSRWPAARCSTCPAGAGSSAASPGCSAAAPTAPC